MEWIVAKLHWILGTIISGLVGVVVWLLKDRSWKTEVDKDREQFKDCVKQMLETLEDQTEKIDEVNSEQKVVKNDIAWIKRYLEDK